MTRPERFAAALAMALLAFCSAVAVRTWRAEWILAQAVEDKKRGNLKSATELYEVALDLGKESAAVELARMALYRQDREKAERYLREAAALNPLDGYVHVLMAYRRAAEQGGEGAGGLEDVLDECRRAVSLSPSDGTVWRDCAELLTTLCLRRDPAWQASEVGRNCRREAVESYRQALRRRQGAAADTLHSLVAAFPDVDFILDVVEGEKARIVQEAVSLMIVEGLWDEWEGRYWQRAFSSPSPGGSTRAALMALGRHRRHEEVFTAAKSYLEGFPDNGEIAYLGASAGARAARGSDAAVKAGELYRIAIELEPRNSSYRKGYGAYLLGQGKLEEARDQLEKAVQLDAGDAEGWYRLGTVMERKGEREEALSSYRKALSLDPRNRRYLRAADGGS